MRELVASYDIPVFIDSGGVEVASLAQLLNTSNFAGVVDHAAQGVLNRPLLGDIRLRLTRAPARILAAGLNGLRSKIFCVRGGSEGEDEVPGHGNRHEDSDEFERCAGEEEEAKEA
jgi:hypothetical protein